MERYKILNLIESNNKMFNWYRRINYLNEVENFKVVSQACCLVLFSFRINNIKKKSYYLLSVTFCARSVRPFDPSRPKKGLCDIDIMKILRKVCVRSSRRNLQPRVKSKIVIVRVVAKVSHEIGGNFPLRYKNATSNPNTVSKIPLYIIIFLFDLII